MNKLILTEEQQSDNLAYVSYSAQYKMAFGSKPNRARFMKAIQENKIEDLYKEISEKTGIDFVFCN